jgi:hypothetical protein
MSISQPSARCDLHLLRVRANDSCLDRFAGGTFMKTQGHDQLLLKFKARFESRMHRHKGNTWVKVLTALQAKPSTLKALAAMEATGGEPDVIGHDKSTGQLIFCDCSAETPTGRRGLCFDRDALNSRRENKPAGSAVEAAAAIGIELLDEQQYRALQELGECDTKTSSWIATPLNERSLGGALFCDRRYGKVFTYHNGAQS